MTVITLFYSIKLIYLIATEMNNEETRSHSLAH